MTLLFLVSMFPVSEPVEKYEGRLQSTGEAKYVDDIPRGEDGNDVMWSIMQNIKYTKYLIIQK